MRGDVSRAWSWRHAIAKSDLPATTKHVLLTLSIFMSEAGQSCFPSVADLVEATSLSKRAVIEHLQKACDAGWLKRDLHGYRGQRWRRLEYEPLWPERDVETEEERGVEGGDAGSPRSGPEAVTVVPEGGDRGAPKLVTDVHHGKDQSIHQSKTSPDRRENARAREDAKPLRLKPVIDPETEARWQALVVAYPPGSLGNLDEAKPLFLDLDPPNQVASAEAVPRFLLARKAEGKSYPLMLKTYLANEDWKRFPQPKNAPTPEPAVDLPAFGKEVWALLWRAVPTAVAGKGTLDRVRNCLGWVSRGVTVPAASLPPQTDIAALVPISIASPECRAWLDYGERIGLRLPLPSAAPVVFVPARFPPDLDLRWKGYHLALPADLEARGPAWWWRLYRPGVAIDEHLRDRSVGNIRVTMGPLPTRAEAEAMVRIEPDTDAWFKWDLWFRARGANLLALHGAIWAPSEYPAPVPARERATAEAAA